MASTANAAEFLKSRIGCRCVAKDAFRLPPPPPLKITECPGLRNGHVWHGQDLKLPRLTVSRLRMPRWRYRLAAVRFVPATGREFRCS